MEEKPDDFTLTADEFIQAAKEFQQDGFTLLMHEPINPIALFTQEEVDQINKELENNAR